MERDKALVIYNSATGFTESYARHIAQALGCPAVELKRLSGRDLEGRELLIFGSRFHAGGVERLKKVWPRLSATGAQVLLFACGGMPHTEEATIAAAWELNLKDLEPRPWHCYLPGGLNYEAMGPVDKLMMKAYVSMMEKKKDKSPEDIAFVNAAKSSYDLRNMSLAQPIIDKALEILER